MQHFLSIDINQRGSRESSRTGTCRPAYVANVDSEGCSVLTLISCMKSVSSSKLMRTDIIREGRHRQFMLLSGSLSLSLRFMPDIAYTPRSTEE